MEIGCAHCALHMCSIDEPFAIVKEIISVKCWLLEQAFHFNAAQSHYFYWFFPFFEPTLHKNKHTFIYSQLGSLFIYQQHFKGPGKIAKDYST